MRMFPTYDVNSKGASPDSDAFSVKKDICGMELLAKESLSLARRTQPSKDEVI